MLGEVVTCNCVRNPGGEPESNPRPSEEGVSFYPVLRPLVHGVQCMVCGVCAAGTGLQQIDRRAKTSALRLLQAPRQDQVCPPRCRCRWVVGEMGGKVPASTSMMSSRLGPDAARSAMPELLRVRVGAPEDVPSHVTATPVGLSAACACTRVRMKRCIFGRAVP